MRTETIKIYTFKELSPKAKEKARDWFREHNDYPFLSEAMNEYAIDLLAEYHIIPNKETVLVWYSLSHCQGDCACIEFVGTWNGKRVYAKHNGRYTNEYSATVEVCTEDETGYCEPEDSTQFIEDVYVPMCRKLRDYGYDYIDYENSNEYIDDTLTINDYEFYADGSIY